MTKNLFWTSDTYRIVKAMKATGNQAGVIECWKAAVELWAETNKGPDADAVKAWLPLWQVRPMYTAEELAPIFPVLAVALGITDRVKPQKSAKRLAHELDYTGLPKRGEFYIVKQIHRWKDIENGL